MKALVLAAGFGTRLLPHTKVVPKPLFTLGGTSLLEITVQKLIRSGCSEVWINSHHLHGEVEKAVHEMAPRCHAELRISHETEILDTGGAIAKLRHALAGGPFFVLNADVISNIDLEALRRAHVESNSLATLALHDRPEFNKVRLDENQAIETFDAQGRGYAFTGIQLLSPEILDHLPTEPAFSSIRLYESLCPTGRIRGHLVPSPFWEDIGTPQAYGRTARHWLAAKNLFPDGTYPGTAEVSIRPLAGDGSDRTWYRAGTDGKNPGLILSDHGIAVPGSERRKQVSAFVHIGRHLKAQGIAVPKILDWDNLSGLVVLEDLGSTHLADAVQALMPNHDPASQEKTKGLTTLYSPVIDALIDFSQRGIQNFDPQWTCQTESYSKSLILEMECRYFLNAFVEGICGRNIPFEGLETEFNYIADNALETGFPGLIHRDCQSRNIMIHKDRPWFIDFQSARKGPLQYDLASLLMDPYVQLPHKVREQLLTLTMEKLKLTRAGEQSDFIRSFEFCCLTRLMQALGAFGFLSKVKGKPQFKAHIPAALEGLYRVIKNLESKEPGHLPKLNALIKTLSP